MEEKAYLIIIGILIASFGFYAWDFYCLNTQVNINSNNIRAIDEFLSKQIEANKQANPQ